MDIRKGYYGYLAGLLTTVTLQPLDNIKMALIVPPSNLNFSSNFVTNVIRASKYIYF